MLNISRRLAAVLLGVKRTLLPPGHSLDFVTPRSFRGLLWKIFQIEKVFLRGEKSDYTRSASNPKIWGRFLIWILKIGDVFGVLSRFSRKNEAMTAESLCMPTCLFPLMKTKENDEFTWSDASFLWFNLSIPAQLEGERKDRRRLGPCMWGKKLKCCPDFSIQFQIVNQCFLSK